jgi:hypothetical protein
VTKQVAIIDPYVGSRLFDHLDALGWKATIRILTADKVLEPKPAAKAAMLAYQAFKGQYPNVEMRTDTEKSLHDRYILSDGKVSAQTFWPCRRNQIRQIHK